MEDQQDPAFARDALEMINADRGQIGERITAETWWGAPAQGLAAALIIVVPAAGLVWAWVPSVLGMGIFVGVEMLFRKRSGLGITRPAGPRGLWLLIAFFLIVFFSFAISMLLVVFGLTGWVVAVAVAAGVATALIVVAYDRAYAAEVRHAG
ncbi:hypothetical protein [Paeniglutamicibacter psychrophenolicus]|uniref:hypothetical protein n=1 Tax=Paeniglutamicibacter psychrophenolicus TaxID=257454 RepID=UPI0027844D5C|nr:hypothetical protein [Paeniglutamicibacter psychrophenolicus]MDQ0093552.1 type IV secretory pathway VirB6-like protein [Paeniglutamicibacter psychrophenolicus]